MRLKVLAISARVPAWVREGWEEYSSRLGPGLKLKLTEIEPGPRTGRATARAVGIEGQRLLAALRSDDYVIALDERGTEPDTRALAAWLAGRMRDGRDLVFLIGGPDGLAPEVLARADWRWSLSRLTFPHALVRVLLAEQLYRAHGVLGNHPYHRE